MIKTWEFDFNLIPGNGVPDHDDKEAVQRAFNHNLSLLASLEKRGFEGVFYSEHHFVDSLSPTPNLLIAALAQRTEKLKIGVMGNVLPFHQPWRLAEELGMLDYLTNGRLEIGVASGVPPEFLFIGVPQEDIRPMYAEILDIVLQAGQQKILNYDGKYYQLDEVPISPRPRDEARRRHWITVYSDTSCRDAARRDCKICTGYQSVDNAKIAYDAYRDEAARLGRTVGPDDIGIRRQVLIWDTDAEAEALQYELQAAAEARMAHKFKDVRARLEKAGLPVPDSVSKSGVVDATAVGRYDGKRPFKGPFNLEIGPDEFIAGSPKTVADKIIDQCRRLGAGNIMAYHNWAMSEAQIAHNYKLWEQVTPILAKADVLEPIAA